MMDVDDFSSPQEDQWPFYNKGLKNFEGKQKKEEKYRMFVTLKKHGHIQFVFLNEGGVEV